MFKKKKIKLSFNTVSAIMGSLLIVGGILLGIYVGVVVMFIGGIVQIIDAVKATPMIPMDIAIGIAKIVLCELGAIIAGVFILMGGIFLAS
ncbi:hypothetical protein [Clostridium tagluense]|uniref:Uncharacterized protein n=1 Tax=Clostridium tagluense TaxID=360422 RepID=A0A401UQ86_9CLOT|nr:hypothetical protein [Clostridium tagluense]GCD11705.1 hypothetical protein Ctaglu_33280 [Clostridium tagluense]